MKWQPISTAPKDGTRILASRKSGRIHIVSWGDYVDAEEDWVSRPCWCVYDSEDAYYSFLLDDEDLAHWMPLPEPPVAK